MKKILIAGLAFLAVITSQAQLTNGVKDSALPTASTVNSVDRLRILQQQNGTNANLTATVGQIIGGATAQDTMTSNAYATTLGNFFVFSNNVTGFSNQVALFTNAAAATLTGHTLTLTEQTNGLAALNNATTNALAVLLAHTNSFYAAANPAGYQTSAQVASAAAAAVTAGLAGFAPAGGAATFTSVSAPVYTSASTNIVLVNVGSITTNLDCSASTVFYVNISAQALSTVTFAPVNLQDGEQATLLIKITSGSSAFTVANGAVQAGFTGVGTTPLVSLSAHSGNAFLFNWYCIGLHQVVFSGAQL
jgi:hypothetical protein